MFGNNKRLEEKIDSLGAKLDQLYTEVAGLYEIKIEAGPRPVKKAPRKKMNQVNAGKQFKLMNLDSGEVTIFRSCNKAAASIGMSLSMLHYRASKKKKPFTHKGQKYFAEYLEKAWHHYSN